MDRPMREHWEPRLAGAVERSFSGDQEKSCLSCQILFSVISAPLVIPDLIGTKGGES